MSMNREEEGILPSTSGSRLSSNNPYRNLDIESFTDIDDEHDHARPPNQPPSKFLTFAVRDRPSNPLKRSNTVVTTKPVQMHEFTTAFENDPAAPPGATTMTFSSSLRRRPSRADSLASSTLLSGHSRLPSYDAIDDVDYSDTARLTANMAGDQQQQQQQQRSSAPRQSLRHRSLHKVATVFRKASRRVVNMQNRDSEEVEAASERPPSSTAPLISHEQQHDHYYSTPEESIPMTPTPSSKSITTHSMEDIFRNKGRKPGIYLAGKSCWIFGPNHPLRKTLARIIFYRWTELFMMFIIALHGVVLLAVGWGNNYMPEPPTRWGQTWDQYVLLGIFCIYSLSIICRIIVYGFVLSPKAADGVQPPKAFLRHSWNRIDLLSVVSYWVDFGLTCAGQVIVGESQRILEFKMLSALILLRLLNITNSNRVILQSLKKAGPLLVTVATFILFFFVVFAIVGVQSFKGSFLRRCVWTDPTNSSNVEIMAQYCGGYMQDGVEKPFLLRNGEPGPWSKGFICPEGLICQETENPYGNTLSFDNIFASMLIAVVIAGNQTWTDLMYDMMDAEYFIACLYFVIIVIILNYWLINLFVAVINEMFAKVREDSKHSAFTASRAKPVLADSEEGWAFGQDAIKKVKSRSKLLPELVRLTRPFWVLVVVVDLIVMGLKNNDMSEEQLATLDKAELGFSLAFLFEIMLRLFSQLPHWRKFFQSRTNQADFFIAIVTCIIQIPPIHDNRPVYAWLTGFQVLRIYRVIVMIPRLRTLTSRVLGSVWGLINLVFFIVLATLLAAILAFQLFEGLLNDSQDEMRFFSIYNSFAALNQLFSGENWTTVLYDAMEAGVLSRTTAVNALFLVLWFMFSNFVLVNMFIAVLMENFETAEEEKRQRQIQQFIRKTETVVEHDPVISKWNIYRYFRPHPKGLNVNNIPANLVWNAKKNVVRDFMADEGLYLAETLDDDMIRPEKKRFSGVRGILERLLHRERPLPNSATRKSLNLIDRNPWDQFHTFYDTGGKLSEREPRSLRLLLESSSSAAAASGEAEAAMHDVEERKALRQEFIYAHPSYDKSLYIFSVNNRIRRWCQMLVPPSRGERFFGTQPSLVASWIFYGIIICSVVTTVVLTIYNSPVYQFQHRNDPQHLLIFAHLDWAFTIIFTLEFVIKVIADGFLLSPNAYLLNGWNVLDLFVLVTLYLSNFGQFASSTGLERAFRAFKALRALRLINLLRPAREMFTVILVKGLPHIVDAACLGVFLIIPFVLYGQNLFQGLFYGCNDSGANITTKSTCVFEAMLGTQAPMPDSTEIYQPRVWDNPYVYSFDSFWKGLSVLVEIASGEGWIDVMVASMSIVGKDQNPQPDASQLTGIFFMVYNLVGSVFVISLFLGVVLENFSKRNGTAYLTVDQRRWLDLKKLLSQMRPAKRPKQVPCDRIRKWCFDLVVQKRGKFYKFMTGVIVINIIFLCTESERDQDIPGMAIARAYVYLGFIGIYWLEIIIKLLGLGWNSFRRNLWNLYDLVVVIGNTATIATALDPQVRQVNVESQKLFMTALCFKLVQRSDSLNQLFTIIAASAYQIANVFAVWFVIWNTYAIMFMEIFGLTKYGTQATNEYVNFRNYANTMISLVRYSSGEGWNTVMHDFTVEPPNCVAAEDYLYSDCGSFSWAYFLFMSFNIISMYMFTAIFVAVVADNFSYVYQIASNFSLVNRDEIRKFKMAWAEFDVNRTGYIEPKDYVAFWRKLGGIFRASIYDPEYSYKNLVQQCKLDDRLVVVKGNPYQVNIDLRALRAKLNGLDKETVHRRKQDLDMLYWEAALTEGPKGVSFNQMLLMLARRKLIIPENALLLEELLNNRKREEVVQTLIKIDRVKGMIETIALRKKFLKHLQEKRISKARTKAANLPSIIMDEQRLSRASNLMALQSAPPTPTADDDNISTASNDHPSSGERIPTVSFIDSYDYFDPEPTRHCAPRGHTDGEGMWHDLLQDELEK